MKFRQERAVFLLLFVLLYSTTIFSQSGLKVISSTSGAACQEVHYFNNYLYVGAGSTLMIFEAGESATPPFTKVFEYRFRSIITDIKHHKGFIFVASNHDGISKWDMGNPSTPQKIAEHIPNNFTESAYDIEFAGDTVFVANGDKVTVLLDSMDHFVELFEFGNQSGSATIKGGAKIDSLFMYTIAYDGTNEGVYFHNLHSQNVESFVPIDLGDPEDILIGNDSIIYVLGGTQSTTNPLNPNGYFYALNISDISNPRLIFSDTLTGVVGGAIAGAVNGEIVNDTIYLATQAAVDPDWQLGDPAEGMIYVYNAIEPSNIQFITAIFAGLWNFDVAVHKDRMFIASEWYGIKTISLSDFNTPRDIGNTLTGGWNKSSDKYGDFLVVGNEGFGFKKYDISDIKNPIVSGINNDNGFCEHVNFSNDGRYIYAMYSTGDGFRIYDTGTLMRVNSIPDNFEIKKSLSYNNYFFTCKTVSLSETVLFRIDVSDVLNPVLDSLTTLPIINDMAAINNRLYISTDLSLYVFSIADTGLRLQCTKDAGLLQAFKALAISNDTVYTNIFNKGLVRYILDSTGSVFELIEDTVVTPVHPNPEFLSVDEYGLYIGYRSYGIYSLSKSTFKQTGYYRTGLGLNGKFGLQDLFCQDGFIFVVEYHSQTTILTNNDTFTRVGRIARSRNDFPPVIAQDQTQSWATFKFNFRTHSLDGRFNLFDTLGRLVYSRTFSENYFNLNLTNFTAGVYYYQIIGVKNNSKLCGKLLVE